VMLVEQAERLGRIAIVPQRAAPTP
jgi:hypothetical protein